MRLTRPRPLSRLIFIALFAGYVWALSGAAQAAPDLPVAFHGHGTFFDQDGAPIKITTEFLENSQADYADWLRGEASPEELSKIENTLHWLDAEFASANFEPALALAWTNGWLVEQLSVPGKASLRNQIHALRLALEDDLGGAPSLPPEAEAQLRDDGALRDGWSEDDTEAYIAECLNAGVPIPPDWGRTGPGEWVDQGELTSPVQVFLPGYTSNRPFTWSSDGSTPGVPRGKCIALPRHNGGNIGLLGIICLGQETSNACFFDNRNVPQNTVVPLEAFRAGAGLALDDWDQGVCSDCHAGENPFVIHPDSTLGPGTGMPNAWHTPLVDPSWPQNPGPTNLLSTVALGANDNSCAGCHSGPSGFAGRFPELSMELPGYCGDVLARAVRRTMPSEACPTLGGTCLNAMNDPVSAADQMTRPYNYDAHANALEAACRRPAPDNGTEVVIPSDFTNDLDFVSPVILNEPLYTCGQGVIVRGAIRHGEIRVYEGPVSSPTLLNAVEALQPNGQQVPVPSLVRDQLLFATQWVDGVESAPSNLALVRDHTEDYPDGMPEPWVEPELIYECGRTIAVRHLPGAKVTVEVNGGSPRTFQSDRNWTGIYPGKFPFDIGDVFTASQSLCDDASGFSDPEEAVSAPTTLPTPRFVPPDVYEGQEMVAVRDLTNGGVTDLALAGGATFMSFSTPVSSTPELDIEDPIGRPLFAGEQLELEHRLCPGVPSVVVTTSSAQPCQEVPPPAPRIRPPNDGDTTIEVLESIPGARVQVYTLGGEEIADGSGRVLTTRRPIAAGEILIAKQTIGQCMSETGWQVTALMFVPEPAGALPLAVGLLGLLFGAHRRRAARLPEA